MALSRRSFIASSATAIMGTLSANVSPPAFAANATDRPMLGLDNFSVRAMGWKAPQLIDYAASIDADSLFITDLDAFESFEDPYLAGGEGACAREAACSSTSARGASVRRRRRSSRIGARPRNTSRSPFVWPRRGIAGHPRGARHVGGSADRRRHRASHRRDGQGVPCLPITSDRRRREDRHREPRWRHALERSRSARSRPPAKTTSASTSTRATRSGRWRIRSQVSKCWGR